MEVTGGVPARAGLLAEMLLGPALTLALALQGTWCLHAGAVAVAGQGVAFVGESGVGKSTLAAYFDEQVPDSWRVADDVLPVTVEEDNLVAFPRYPQLGLPAQAQIGAVGPERLPIERIYLLAPSFDASKAPGAAVSPLRGRSRERGAALPTGCCLLGGSATQHPVCEVSSQGDANVAVHPVAPRQAALTLARHTVSGRLFGPALLSQHLSFCARTVRRLRLGRLTYPHDRRLLPRIARVIATRPLK